MKHLTNVWPFCVSSIRLVANYYEIIITHAPSLALFFRSLYAAQLIRLE